MLNDAEARASITQCHSITGSETRSRISFVFNVTSWVRAGAPARVPPSVQAEQRPSPPASLYPPFPGACNLMKMCLVLIGPLVVNSGACQEVQAECGGVGCGGLQRL